MQKTGLVLHILFYFNALLLLLVQCWIKKKNRLVLVAVVAEIWIDKKHFSTDNVKQREQPLSALCDNGKQKDSFNASHRWNGKDSCLGKSSISPL